MQIDGEDMCIHLDPAPDAPPLSGFLHVPRVNDALLIEEISALSRNGTSRDASDRVVSNFRATAVLLALIGFASLIRRETSARPSERRILRAEQFMRANFATIKTIKEVADHVGISYDSLRHSYRQERNKSLIRFLNEMRIERVKTMLIHTQLSIKEIASSCGFNDEYYLSVVFRKLLGTTLGRYRENNS